MNFKATTLNTFPRHAGGRLQKTPCILTQRAYNGRRHREHEVNWQQPPKMKTLNLFSSQRSWVMTEIQGRHVAYKPIPSFNIEIDVLHFNFCQRHVARYTAAETRKAVNIFTGIGLVQSMTISIWDKAKQNYPAFWRVQSARYYWSLSMLHLPLHFIFLRKLIKAIIATGGTRELRLRSIPLGQNWSSHHSKTENYYQKTTGPRPGKRALEWLA